MFYYYETIKVKHLLIVSSRVVFLELALARSFCKFQMLRITGLVVRETEEKIIYFDECCYTNRPVKLVINRRDNKL